MRERDLAGEDGIVIGDVRNRVVAAVFQFDVHPAAELLDVEGRRVPVDADLGAHPPGLLSREVSTCRHAALQVKMICPPAAFSYNSPTLMMSSTWGAKSSIVRPNMSTLALQA